MLAFFKTKLLKNENLRYNVIENQNKRGKIKWIQNNI